jgi:hypothetical protein
MAQRSCRDLLNGVPGFCETANPPTTVLFAARDNRKLEGDLTRRALSVWR